MFHFHSHSRSDVAITLIILLNHLKELHICIHIFALSSVHHSEIRFCVSIHRIRSRKVCKLNTRQLDNCNNNPRKQMHFHCCDHMSHIIGSKWVLVSLYVFTLFRWFIHETIKKSERKREGNHSRKCVACLSACLLVFQPACLRDKHIITLLAKETQKKIMRTKCIILHWCEIFGVCVCVRVYCTELWPGDAWQSTCKCACACVRLSPKQIMWSNERGKARKITKFCFVKIATERTTPVIFSARTYACGLLCTTGK